MKTITLFAIILTFTTVNSFSQITMESLDLEVAQLDNSGSKLFYSKAGPIMIAKAGTIDFQLDSIGFNRIDANWIQSISVFKKSESGEMFGYPTENGLIVITLKEEHIKDFLSGKEVEDPLRIKRTQ
jgi:hypothetical protein